MDYKVSNDFRKQIRENTIVAEDLGMVISRQDQKPVDKIAHQRVKVNTI